MLWIRVWGLAFNSPLFHSFLSGAISRIPTVVKLTREPISVANLPSMLILEHLYIQTADLSKQAQMDGHLGSGVLPGRTAPTN